MNARLDQSKRTLAPGEPSEWQIAVVYDDPLTRDRAMQLVQMLQNRFAGDIAFSCTWWRFRYLNDPEIALVARHYACAAEIVVFSTDSPGLFPLPAMNWIESWAAARRKSGGVVVPLLGSPNIPSQLFSTKHFYLRHVAERSGMDYLPPSVIASAASLPSPNVPLAGSKQQSYDI
jgi:hypothetical protein